MRASTLERTRSESRDRTMDSYQQRFENDKLYDERYDERRPSTTLHARSSERSASTRRVNVHEHRGLEFQSTIRAVARVERSRTRGTSARPQRRTVWMRSRVRDEYSRAKRPASSSDDRIDETRECTRRLCAGRVRTATGVARFTDDRA